MSSHFKHFITLLEKEISDKIESIVKFGSRSGEINPHLSDIDLLIIARTKQNIPFIVSTVRRLEKEILKVSHSTFTQEEEEKIFGSLDFTGVHLIAIAKDEINENLQPKSLRLKILFRLILSRNMFIYHLEHDSKVLLGKDLFRNIPCQKPTFTDRVKIFVPLFFILSVIPFAIRNRRKFRIWCFKVIKW